MNFKKYKGTPIWPALLSALVAPGVGQLVNREIAKGIFLLTTFLASSFWLMKVVTQRLMEIMPGSPETWGDNKEALQSALEQLVQQTPDMFRTFQLLVLVLWIYGIVDAYVVAKNGPTPPKPLEPSDEE